MVNVTSFAMSLTSLSHDCTEFAVRHTYAALDADILVDDVRLAHLAGNGVGGAVARTERTAAALGGVDGIGQQRFTHARVTVLLLNVVHILLTEVAESGKDGVGCGLPQRAQRGLLHVRGKLLDFDEVLRLALALGDLGQKLQ